MVHIVKGIALKVVLISTVTRRGAEQKMNAVPDESKWGTEKDKTGKKTRIVIEMLHGVHAET